MIFVKLWIQSYSLHEPAFNGAISERQSFLIGKLYTIDQWKKNGVFEKINAALNQLERLQNDRERTPCLGLADSQSIKLAPMICEHRGTDGNKKVNGRKRQIIVDVLGRLYQCHIHAANLHDSPQGVHLLDKIQSSMERLCKIMADKTYRGTFAQAVEQAGLAFETPNRPNNTKGFIVEAKRWIVERTFAWFNFFRRVAMDYEHTPESSKTFLFLANISICLWRINFNEL